MGSQWKQISVEWVKRTCAGTYCVATRQTQIWSFELQFGKRRPTELLQHGGPALTSGRAQRIAPGRPFPA
jgi:hypothetical protein